MPLALLVPSPMAVQLAMLSAQCSVAQTCDLDSHPWGRVVLETGKWPHNLKPSPVWGSK